MTQNSLTITNKEFILYLEGYQLFWHKVMLNTVLEIGLGFDA
ncbi:hypothetical protein [Nostoc sp. CCY 9925]